MPRFDKTRVEVRSSVRWFSEEMEKKLRRYDYRGGWEECSPDWILARMYDEILELIEAKNKKDWANVIEEAADVANFAMMMASIAQELRGEVEG